MRSAIDTVLRVLAAEGPVAARDRLLDRLQEWRRRRRFRVSRAGEGAPAISASLLNVLPTPPSPRLGGIQIQFLRRLRFEVEERACALLYPEGGGYRLERQRGRHRDAVALAGPALSSPLALEDAPFEAAVLRGAERAGARGLHVEGLSGLPAGSLLGARRAGLRVVLTLHDFSLFCPRPHLLEQPGSRFCRYCEDLPRCHACLGAEWDVPQDFQRRYREVGAELLRAADAVVYPSDFLRSRFLDLVRGLDPAVHRVIAPGGPLHVPVTRSGSDVARPPVQHIALVGSVRIQKGARVFEEVVRHLAADGSRSIRWSVFGGGEADLLHRLRRLPGVSVRGYYRAGSLPRLLREHGVDLALLLSTSPESYGLTLDECLAAGVPVIAFDHGAIAERVRRVGGGILVPLEADYRGVVDALRGVLGNQRPEVPRAIPDLLPQARQAARAHLQLYRELHLV